jgi:PAS domain S-box-containing protein
LEKGAWSVAYRLLGQNGGHRWVQESGRVMQEGGDPMVVGTLTDITDLRALEEQARELAATLEAVLHTSLLAIAGLDADLRLVLANERFCDLVGYSRQAIQGMPAAAFAPAPQDLRADGGSGDELAAAVQALLAEPDQRQRRRLALRGQDGRLITVTAEIQAVAQQGGAMRVLLIAQELAPESA